MPNTIRIHSFPLSGYGHRVELFASVAGINYEVINVDVQKFFKQLDAHLDGRCWLVGDGPTIADIAIYSYTAHAPEGGISLAPYPNIRRLLLRSSSHRPMTSALILMRTR